MDASCPLLPKPAPGSTGHRRPGHDTFTSPKLFSLAMASPWTRQPLGLPDTWAILSVVFPSVAKQALNYLKRTRMET